MIGTGRIERYVVGRTLGSVGAALAVISAVILLVEFVDLSRSVGVRVDVSIGIALAPHHGTEVSSLLRRADIAMYHAKARRSGHHVYDVASNSWSRLNDMPFGALTHAGTTTDGNFVYLAGGYPGDPNHGQTFSTTNVWPSGGGII